MRSHNKRVSFLLLALVSVVGVIGCSTAGLCTISELTGILKKAEDNHSPFVLIIEGEIERMYLRGDVLKGANLGSRVKVSGVLHSELYLRSSVPPPSGWHIFMTVQTCRGISKPFDGERK